ncbi:MAG: ABC transporter substrate-binding protein [Gammaproteobacteria bacterium]|nr:ABC transporter substrate-binding protein [Gammaproteobacteria bacterium]
MTLLLRLTALLVLPLLAACGASPWNSPYPAADAGKNITYSSFADKPKHLDPAQSYSSNEITFTAQIYEPPLQYHYLKRPYTLIPLAAAELPRPLFLDAQGKALPAGSAPEKIAFSVYEIRIKPGMRYQPHPAFARDAQGNYLYHNLKAADLSRIYKLADFPQTGTRELVAADYVYQIKRLAHPRLNSPIFGLMSEYIVGLKAYSQTLDKAQKDLPPGGFLDLSRFPLEGAEVVDRYTYRVKLKGKYPQFLYWLAMPFFAPVPAEADRFYSQPGMAEKNITLDWYPVGSGPYMLTVNDPNRRMVLERNPNFHGENYPSEGEPGDAAAGLLRDAGKPLPFIDKAVFSLEKESIPYWNKFLQGYYDASGITSDSFDQAVRVTTQGEADVTDMMREKGIRLQTAVTATNYYYGFNMLDPVIGGFSERARKLRQAISVAIDYEEFISIFANGRGIPAQGPIPPGIFGSREGAAGINPYVYDWVDGRPKRKPVEVARKLLAEAGYPEGRDAQTGKPLLLYLDITASGPDDKARLDWIRKQFQKIDLQLVVRNTDYNRFQDKIRKGNAQIFHWGWNADYPDPENFLFLLYGPNARVGKEGENSANYDNPEFNRLFEQMKNMDNGPARQNIIDAMLRIARHDAPWIWGFHPKQYGLYHAWYQNIKPNLMANNGLKYVRVDAALRARKQREWNRPVLWPLGLLAVALAAGIVPAVAAYRRKERQAAK